jgi:hypothetical protein
MVSVQVFSTLKRYKLRDGSSALIKVSDAFRLDRS